MDEVKIKSRKMGPTSYWRIPFMLCQSVLSFLGYDFFKI